MKVSTKNLIGEVKGRTVLMFDDMISTAGTVCEAAKMVMEHGARDVIVSAQYTLQKCKTTLDSSARSTTLTVLLFFSSFVISVRTASSSEKRVKSVCLAPGGPA